jgi:glycerophosphoryl diester phosphodiesterase
MSDPNVRIIAHRGHSAVAPENTLAAFAAAANLDAVDMIECDVWMAVDTEPVVIHDRDLARTTDGSGDVTGKTTAELAELDAGSWFDLAFAGQRVPTLTGFLDAIGDKLPVVELKDAAAVDPALRELEARGLVGSALVECFDLEVLIAMRLRCPQVKLAYLIDRAPNDADLGAVSDLSLTALSCRADALGRGDVRTVHRAGGSVFAWTVNESAEMLRLAKIGVDAIFTDDPPAAARALRR